MRNAVRDDARLPAARACENQYRAIGSRYGFTLLGVEAREEIHYQSILLDASLHWVEVSYIKVASLDQLPPGELLEVEVNNKLYALCNVAGEIRAVHGTCPHHGGPLGQGALEGSLLSCPWHA